MDHIYPDQRIVCDRTIDSHIKKLRKKLAAAAIPGEEFIQSLMVNINLTSRLFEFFLGLLHIKGYRHAQNQNLL